MNSLIPKTIGITEFRTKTRKIFDSLKKENLPFLVLRDSKPEAVLISYKEYELLAWEKRKLWNMKLDELATKTKPYVSTWLKKKGYNAQKVGGDKLVKILEEEDAKSCR